MRLDKVARDRRAMTEALRKLEITEPEARYDFEYSTARELRALTGVPVSFGGTHYWFDSPVLQGKFLQSIISESKVLDVGAGNGTLLRKLVSLGISPDRLTGVDISQKAVDRIREIGAQAFHGTISVVPDTLYSTIFLSYFVDRDADQKATFTRTAELLSPNGVVVLEGLFPCVLEDSNGVLYGTSNVTKGCNAEEDIALVAAEFHQLGLLLEKRLDGERQVYSLDGPEALPSYTLVFKKI